jgi:hypothetical protein
MTQQRSGGSSMPRIRTIKPEFCQSESVGKLSRDARLLFIQLWTLCDDYGRCRAADRLLASQLYPYDDDAAHLMPKWLGELERGGMVVRYEVEGSSYLEISNWSKHQRIDNAGKSMVPAPNNGVRGGSPRAAASLREPPLDLGPGPGPGPGPVPRTRRGEEDEPSAQTGTRAGAATRLPQDWSPSDKEMLWAKSQRPDLNLTETVERFRDYWIAQPGARGRRADWSATWRNWVRNERQNHGAPMRSGKVVPLQPQRTAGRLPMRGQMDDTHLDFPAPPKSEGMNNG